MKKLLAVGVIVLFLGLAIAPSINAVEQNTNEYKPTRFPFITYPSLISVELENLSNLTSPIPPGKWVSITLVIGYSISGPDFLKYLPWPLITLWLFFSFHYKMQKIWFEFTDVPNYTDIVLEENQFCIPILFDGEITKISNTMYICVGENTPIGLHSIVLHTYCNDVGRIKGNEFRRTISFEVGYE